MVYVTALLPVVEGVPCFAALRQACASATADGDPRGRGQLMADTLVGRLTGRDPLTAPADVHADLAMTDATLLGAAGRAWLRRLYLGPDRSTLVAMDSRSHRFPALLAHLVEIGDQTCRTPYCAAPIAHTDHVRANADDGLTDRYDARGLCQRCNHGEQAPGWSARRARDGTVTTTTPTGRVYSGSSPPVPGGLAGPAPDDAGAIVVDLHHAPDAWHPRTA